MLEMGVTIAAASWLVWILVNVGLFLLGAFCIEPQNPQFNGFKVQVPRWIYEQLEPDEIVAVIHHELGHKAHWHIWTNLIRVCLCFPIGLKGRVRQELEADDFVTDPAALASALTKISNEPFDLLRARRLMQRAGMGSREASHLSARDGRVAPT